MKIQKIIILAVLSIFPFSFVVAETSTGEINSAIADLQSKIKKNSENIVQLENENERLRDQISGLKNKMNPNIIIVTSTTTPTSSGVITKISNIEKYNKIIEKINSMSGKIFDDNKLSTASQIGLFEFIEPSNFFISIDDGANPAGVTAFKKKILYSYDMDFNFNIEGIFELDYLSQYYITKYGKNPFTKATRIRIPNSTYTGKLLNIENSNTSTIPKVTTITNSTTTNTTASGSSDITFEMVKGAYDRNKILDALRLSNDYIIKDPNNFEIMKIRYRSFFVLGKYTEALAEIQKIEQLKGEDKVEKIILCDAKTIAKLAKNTELNKKYADLCSAKK